MRVVERLVRSAKGIGLAVAVTVATVGAPVHAAEPAVATLAVSATGSVTARPDVGVVTVGAVSVARTSAEALAGADKAARSLLEEVAAVGIAKDDVATTEFSLAPQWVQKRRDGRDVEEIVGYQVANRFTVKVRRLADLGPLLERVIGKGSNSVSGLSFEVSDADAKRDQARAAAVAEALHRAELLTAAAGQRIVRVLSMSEGGSVPPRPVFATMKAMDAAPAVPVEAGTETITAEVSMTFEIAPKSTP